jgi:hypothetical protein
MVLFARGGRKEEGGDGWMMDEEFGGGRRMILLEDGRGCTTPLRDDSALRHSR